MLRRALIFTCLLLITACGARDVQTLSPRLSSASIQTVFFATARAEGQTGRIFGQGRLKKLHFGQVDVSIPPNHVAGELEWRNATPNPEKEFALAGVIEDMSASEFVAAIQRHKASPREDTLVFVHGYNTTATEAGFRLAQIQEDFGFDSSGVVFSWPSAGQAGGYIYDRDSVLFARDDLEQVLNLLTRGNRKVILFSHSMGSQLVMETLRQAKLKGNRHLLNGLNGVVLMSPDIDTDVFHRQAETIGKLPQPFVIFAAKQDRALRLSSLLTGSRPRLGAHVSAETLDRDDVTIFDFSEYADGTQFNHLVPVTSPAAIKFLRNIANVTAAASDEFKDFVSNVAQAH